MSIDAIKRADPPTLIVEEQIEQIANKTIPLYAWIGVIVFAIATGFLLLWTIFGSVSIYIEGKGILLNQNGLFTIQTPIKGVVKALFVKPGDNIVPDNLVAEIEDPKKSEALLATQRNVDALTKEVDHLQHQIEVETEAFRKSLKLELEALQYSSQLLEKQKQFLDKEYEKKKTLHEEQLIILSIVEEAQRQIHDVEVIIAENGKKISETEVKFIQSYRTEELKNKEMALLKAQHELYIAQTAMNENKIHSPHRGKVLEILAREGETVNEKEQIINAEFWSPDEKLVFYAYFPSEFGKYLHVGATMKIYPSTINKNEFGTLISHIERVSEYPISEKGIVNKVHNTDLARYLSNQQPVTQVIAIPVMDPKDPSGYAWTSHRGPAINLTTGIVGTTEVAIETIHPIYYILPNPQLKKTAIKNPLP